MHISCSKCLSTKMEKDFYPITSGKGKRSICKDCCRSNNSSYYEKNRKKIIKKTSDYAKNNPKYIKEKANKWRKANSKKIKAYQRSYHLKSKFNLTQSQYETLLEKQQNCCDICKEPFTITASIDHDHITGRVRGLLCKRCNLLIGYAQDNLQLLDRASDYLRFYGSIS